MHKHNDISNISHINAYGKVALLVTYLMAWRKEQGLTQKEAALHVGIPHLTYRLIENGRLEPSPRDWDALRAQFGPDAERMISPAQFPTRGRK